MRVPDSYLVDRSQYYINLAYYKLSEIQEDISSGKKLRAPSDDPISFIEANHIKYQQEQYNVYKKNITFLSTTLNITAQSLQDIKDVMMKVKELTVQGLNEVSDNTPRYAIVKQLNQLLKQAVNIANRKYNDIYIFGADSSVNKPFKIIGDPPVDVVYQGGKSLVNKLVGKDLYIQENFIGDNVLNGGYNKYLSVFKSILNVIDLFSTNESKSLASINNTSRVVNPANSLANEYNAGNLSIQPSVNGVFNINGVDIAWNNTDSINTIIANINANVSNVTASYDNVNQKIVIKPNDKNRLVYIYDKTGNFTEFTYLKTPDKQIDDVIDYISLQESRVGALTNRLDNISSMHELTMQNLVERLSSLEDTDFAKAVSEMTMQEMVYKSALNVASRLERANLFDYLR